MLKSEHILIAGAGMFGIAAAEHLARLGKRVVICEKRDHIGGNCYDKRDEETGILYHVYGPHILHADDERVWSYLNRFTEVNSYFHQVLTTHKGQIYQMPINLETVNSFYGLNMRPYEVEAFLKEEAAKESIESPRNMEEKCISLIGRPLYEAFFRNYTLKQWERDPRDLPASIFNRLPVRTNYYESYFFSRYVGIPLDGYTAMFKKMIDHPHIEVRLNTDCADAAKTMPDGFFTIHTGAIDRFFDYRHGRLDYRTLRFEKEVQPYRDWQGTSVMNYADPEIPYTRICEPRHFHTEKWDEYPQDKTLTIREYSAADDGGAPFYPINDGKNREILALYQKDAERLDAVLFGGRLGGYKYYDMDAILKEVLDLFGEQV